MKAISALVATCVVGSPAFADNERGYLREVVIVDGVAAATVGLAVAAGVWVFASEDFHLPLLVGAIGFTGYVLAPPIVHLRHGRVGRGVLSFGTRILVPAIVGTILPIAAGLEEQDRHYDRYFSGGMALGAGLAVALDWWLIVPDAATRTDAAARTDVAPSLTVVPTVGGGVVGLAGTW